MHYRLWDGTPPRLQDECGIAACDGAAVVPDVVLVPCVGFTRSGYRLGYGGGYFDRTLAACARRPIAIGLGFADSLLPTIYPQDHDIPMNMIVTDTSVQRFTPGL